MRSRGMDDCIFCRIVQGEIPGDPVHQNDEFVAIRDIAPKADVHLLVLPRAHTRDLDSFVDEGGDGVGLLRFVREAADKAGIAGRYRVVANVGADAGQEVFHLHLHLLSGGRLPAL